MFRPIYGIFISLAVLLAGCSESTTPATGGVAAFSSVVSSINVAGALLPNVTARSSRVDTAFSTTWSDSAVVGMSNPKYDGTPECAAFNANVSVKDWMGYQFDESAARCNGSSINIFGRVKGQLAIFCAVSSVVGSYATSADIPAATTPITFSATAKANMLASCGISPDVPDDTVISLTVSHPASTLFDTIFALDQDGDGTADMSVYLTFSAATVRIVSNEVNSNGRQRVIVDLNRSTNVIRAEYLSRNSTGGIYIHRLYGDSAADVARVMSQEGGTTSEYRRYVVTGKPSSTTENDVAVSVDINNASSGSLGTQSGGFDRNACVNKNTGAITTDGPAQTSGAFTCGAVTGKTVDISTGFDTTMTAINAATTSWNDLTATTALSWTTIDDMLTSAL